MNLPRRVGIGAGLLPFLRLLHEPVLLVTNHRISFANEAAWRLFGVERGQLIGRSPLALFHPDSIAKAGLRQRASASRARGTPVLTEQILRPDGSTRTVHTTVTQISPPPQQLQLLVLHDVSDLQRKRRQSLQGQAELQELGMARVALTDMRRRHLARELHDELQQSLVAIQLELAAISDGARPERPPFARVPVAGRPGHQRRDRRHPAHHQQHPAADPRRTGPGAGPGVPGEQVRAASPVWQPV